MAVVDTTKLARYHAIFPELTAIQSETCVMLALGLTIKTVAEARNVSAETIKESLRSIRQRLGVNSLSEVRIAVNVRLTLKMMETML